MTKEVALKIEEGAKTMIEMDILIPIMIHNHIQMEMQMPSHSKELNGGIKMGMASGIIKWVCNQILALTLLEPVNSRL